MQPYKFDTSLSLDTLFSQSGRQFNYILEELIEKLLVCEGVQSIKRSWNRGPDFTGEVLLNEPGGYVRNEKWGFEIKARARGRLDLQTVNQVLGYYKANNDKESGFDIICLITSGEVTSIVREFQKKH